MKSTNKASKSVAVYLAVLAIVALLVPAYSGSVQQQQTHGIVVANMDLSVKPGDDFYAYTNGDWLKRTEIPPDRAAVSVSSVLDDIASKRTADLIEQVAESKAAAGSNLRKFADLYNSYLQDAVIYARRVLSPP